MKYEILRDVTVIAELEDREVATRIAKNLNEQPADPFFNYVYTVRYVAEPNENMSPLDVQQNHLLAELNDSSAASQFVEDMTDDYMSPEGEGRDDHLNY